jgi:hypothetical protein
MRLNYFLVIQCVCAGLTAAYYSVQQHRFHPFCIVFLAFLVGAMQPLVKNNGKTED